MPPQTYNFEGIPDAASKSGGLNFEGIPDATEKKAGGLSAKTAARVKKMQERRAQPTSEPVLDALQGIGQGAISTVQTLATPIRKAFGMKPAEPPPEATTTAMKAGRAAEQVGEFFVPEAVAGKVAGAMKAGRLVKAGVKAGISAAGNYGVAKAQGDERPGVAAAVGAAGPAVDLTAPMAFKFLRRGARAGLERVLGASPTTPSAMNATLKTIVPTALDEGLKPTWKSWLAQREGARKVSGKTLASAIGTETNPGPLRNIPVKIQPILDALDELGANAAQHIKKIPGEWGEDAVRDVPLEPYNRYLADQLKDLKKTLLQYGDEVPAGQIHDLKKSWDEFVYPASGRFKTTAALIAGMEARVKHTAANAARAVLDSDAPSVAKLDNAAWLNIKLHEAVLEAAKGGEKAPGTSTAKAAAMMIARRAGVGSGAALGGAYGYQKEGIVGAVGGAMLGGLLGQQLDTFFASPAFRTLLPATKNALAKAIADGKADTVKKIITPFLAKAGAGSPAEAK